MKPTRMVQMISSLIYLLLILALHPAPRALADHPIPPEQSQDCRIGWTQTVTLNDSETYNVGPVYNRQTFFVELPSEDVYATYTSTERFSLNDEVFEAKVRTVTFKAEEDYADAIFGPAAVYVSIKRTNPAPGDLTVKVGSEFDCH